MEIEKILARYFKILQEKEKARFLLAKSKSVLNRKIEEAFSILKNCELCERKCHINRLKGEKGFCQVQNKMLIGSYSPHYGEEPFFVPSFTIFFWSCTFECQYCQNWSISQRFEKPITMNEKELARIIDSCDCKNVNFVGGSPTPQLPFILKTLKYTTKNIPVIWNSNFYMSEKSMSLLEGMVDIYLSDFKYGNDKCAKRLSNVNNYTAIVKRNHLLAAQDSEMVIRHLVLPGHVKCCSKPILKWISVNLGKKVIVNIMDQYKPDFLVLKERKYKEINRTVTTKEFQTVVNYAKELDLNFIC